jgi:hypothetical protein
VLGVAQIARDVKPFALGRHHHIENDQVRFLGPHFFETFCPVVRDNDPVPIVLEYDSVHLDKVGVIINEQHCLLGFHDCILLSGVVEIVELFRT